MNVMLHHLTGSLRGQTQYFEADALRFGTGSDCDVRFHAADDRHVAPAHAEFALHDHSPTLRDLTGQHALFINNRQTIQAALHDGDLIQLGEHGPLIRFRVLDDQANGHKPWQYIVEDSRDIVVRTPHRPYTSLFHLARHVISDIARYGSPTAKMVAALLLLLPLLLIGMLSVSWYYEYQAAEVIRKNVAELVSQVETGRLGRAELEARVAQEREVVRKLQQNQEELKANLIAALDNRQTARQSQEEVRAIQKQLSELESEQRFAEEVIQRFQGGVGLLQGGYGIVEQGTGRPLRYQGYNQDGTPLVDEHGVPFLTLEGNAPPVIIFFSGTGLLIDKKGTVLTNRHLVRMWEVYGPVKAILEKGFEPSMEFLRIFFPGFPGFYELKEIAIVEHNDFAILQTASPPKDQTPLQLAPAHHRIRIGEPVIIMSYPGTVDSILSRLSRTDSERILQQVGGDPVALPDKLAAEGLIRPLTTHGYVADVSSEVVTFEARASQGSSGGAVLNREGLVIAVNHSELRAIGGINLGVPIEIIRKELVRLSRSPAGKS
ncbi:MAG: trypsin-like peptidase domain-containing protein [Nitrospira sp.]|nr:trypsin-like peptidase domain-containing protein [Nitrospira sp.]MCW5784420.1 trypsin-like peptidase domain-containing protein [Nitrospirales bacterium]